MTIFPNVVFERIGAVIDSSRAPFFTGRRPASRDGSYRSDTDFVGRRPGTRVVLRAERGVTQDGFLAVPFRFQHPPLNQFERPLSVPWPTFETLSANERSRPQGAALRQHQLDTYFHWEPDGLEIWTGTHSHQPSVVNGCYEPQLFIDELNTLAEEEVIFRLYAHDPVQWGVSALLNMLATIIAVTPVQKNGEIGTEYVTIVFQQFRELVEAQQRRGASRKVPTTYRPHVDDDLYTIATDLLGRPSDWRRVAAVNGIVNVAPDSPAQLQAWLQAHHRAYLKVPPVQKQEQRPTRGGR